MKPLLHQCQLLIGSEHRAAASGATFEVRSPANGDPVGIVALADLADVEAAVAAALAAFETWSLLPAAEREARIRRASAHVRTQAREIGMLMALEQGKPLNQSVSEVISSCDTIDYFAAEGVRIEGSINQTESRSVRSWVTYQPVGVCALITPWNYPVSLLSWKLGPALASGCAVVVKPSEVTPMSSSAFCKSLMDGGIPAGVINTLCGGSDIGRALTEHTDVSKIAMTGSTAVGKVIMQSAAKSLKRVTLELGGQCPAIVCRDANLANAATVIAYKAFRNMGQSCSSINRVYAHRALHDELVDKLVQIAERLTIGDGISDPSVDLGPMATAAALANVEEHVSDALGQGARLAYGGTRPAGGEYAAGNYFLPTILTEVKSGMKVLMDETFGPVAPIVVFDDLADAVRQANDSDFGLVSYLFTKDYATVMRVSEALDAGTVCVNTGAVNTNYAPYAGWKDSGFGFELSREAIFEYLKIKHTKVQLV